MSLVLSLRRLAHARKSTQVIAVALLALLLCAPLLSFVRLPSALAGSLFGIPLLAIALAVLRKLRFGWATIAIVAAGMVLYTLYFGYTSLGERNHDGPEQLKYIRFIVANGAIPKADQCFVCHHPPAYYLLAAGAYKLCEVTHWVAPHRGVQLMSLGLAFGFIVFGSLTIRRFTDKPALVAMAAGMLTFWPYSTMNSVRMHNDILFGTLMAAGLYMVVRWQQDDEPRDLWIACAIAALSVMTKSSGYVLVATIGAVWLYRLVAETGRLSLLRATYRPLLAVGAVIAVFAFARGPSTKASAGERVFGTAFKIQPHDWVGNEPHNYLYFDLESFVREPYLLSRRDGSGRQYYWNHLLKSSLFATHNERPDVETSYRFNRRLAEIMNLLLLAMVIYGVAALAGAKKRSMGRFVAPIAFFCAFLGMHIAFKVIIPSAHHNDFRLVYPVLIVGSLSYVLAVDGFSQRRPPVGYFGHLLAIPFLLMSIVYYLPKYSFVVRHFPRKVLRHTPASLSKVRAERVDWWRPPNVVLAGDELIEINLGRARELHHIDASFDGNDRYTVQLIGRGEPRIISIGPKPKEKNFKGLVRYKLELDPPAEKIHAVRIWPSRGDMSYSVGHFIVR
jgi:hypothetical protein